MLRRKTYSGGDNGAHSWAMVQSLIDSQLSFVPIGGAGLSLIAAAAANIASTNTPDILGAGVGQAPPGIIGNATLFGQDPGVGRYVPYIEFILGTALASAGTLNVALQFAPDTGAGGGYLPGAWQTVTETGAEAAAFWTALTPFRLSFAPTVVQQMRARFMRLLFQQSAAVTAGLVNNAFITLGRDDQANKLAAKNFTVA